MPKVVDHEAYRQELAAKAADVFTQHGYNGLGMRAIAEAIGVSKSALYHYFPSKQELFAACTELVTQPRNIYGTAEHEELPSTHEKALTALLTALDSKFLGEMTLLMDYLRGRDAKEIAEDPLMQMADSQYLAELEKLVGHSNANKAYALILGGLMMRLFNGNRTEINEIESWINELSLK